MDDKICKKCFITQFCHFSFIDWRLNLNSKPKLSFNQLYDKIKSRGITFDCHTRDQVIEILKYKNYYYRLISYRKNFSIVNEKYIGLDFAALLDLSSIDTYLREYLLQLCLDVEHAMKTHLMTHLTENAEEDGYSIIEEFSVEYEKLYQKTITHFEKNRYKRDMFNKRKDVSIWVFLEIIDFGTLNTFINFYARKKPEFKSIFDPCLIKFVKNIRNACAHNDVFFINIYSNQHSTHRPSSNVVSFGYLMDIRRNDLKSQKINDIIVLHYLHHILCSEALNQRRKQQGNRLIERTLKNKHYYNQCLQYHRFFNTLNKCVDFLTRR